MKSLQKVKTAVIGYGKISDIYLTNMINKFEIVDVIGCGGRDVEKAQEKAKLFGIKGMHVDEIMDNTEIELVVNLTPPTAHYEIIKKALEAGKNVYTEKIVTPDLKEALELKELAKKCNLRLGCAPDTFLGAGIQSARKVVESGGIGKIVSCHAAVNRDMEFLYYPGAFHTKHGGGIGFNVGIYYLSALLSILGSVEQVSGFAYNTKPECKVEDPSSPLFGESFNVDSENIMVASLQFKNGVYGTMNFSSNTIWPQVPMLMIYGTEGILHLPDPDKFGGKVYLQKKGMSDQIEVPNSYGYGENSRGLGVAEMAWAMRKERPHRANFNMGCHALEVLSGVVKCSETGQVQRMETDFELLPALPEGYLDNYFGRNQECALIV
ncbi:oxidoreductase [Anaerocolumna cellulosilytica]|uniref:Oxidoreductase n=1 Tax=Anaerocolumna cellulosilytica TaxID=433286 RepID=A0A6S6R5Q8_9FIRM|nr:Gfo/Idh/MocA family oxidoreductase [Anaerocolumna cellulosilytica]MBB5197419.1 putative dehydrogenase [Anaerocolumna cellulosilytica]BCJ95437.1 oxidoreductase [Anaerocolumna cellulosilytica]